MRVDVGSGVRLYVDVDGMGLVPVDGKMVQRPTLLLLHGGPGMDHATYRLGMHELRDVAQVVMYDHRGQGRSDERTPDEWTLDNWADDVVRLCDALEIIKPIVFGNSFGGMVAQRYIGRHPEHPSKVVISSTVPRWNLEPVVAMFGKLGGDQAAAVAKTYWTNPTNENIAVYLDVCGPLYTQTPGNMFTAVESVRRRAVGEMWARGEGITFDTRTDLAKAQCPVLVLGGEHDPVCPIVGSEEIADCLPAHLVQFERFANSGHGVFRDEPERAMRILRHFIAR